MQQQSGWKQLINFGKRDRRAAAMLLAIIAGAILWMLFYPASPGPLPTVSTLQAELARQGIDTVNSAADPIVYEPSDDNEAASPVALFAFDPNTLDAAGFKRLGLPDKTINTILKYRSKGGRFWRPEDLRKLYTLRKEDADRLIPYVRMETKPPAYAAAGKRETNYPKPVPIDINTATLEQWKALPTIGDALAARIIKFREKRGGFTSVAQVAQTYGLSDSAFGVILPYLRLTAPAAATASSTTPLPSQKININTATVRELQTNPAIPADVAQAIVIYRTQHGPYQKVEDIRNIVFINEAMYGQIAAFLTVE